MSKIRKVKVSYSYEVEVPYVAYDTKYKNKRAKKAIAAWIKDSMVIRNNGGWLKQIPIYIEKDKDGCSIEDYCLEPKIKEAFKVK